MPGLPCLSPYGLAVKHILMFGIPDVSRPVVSRPAVCRPAVSRPAARLCIALSQIQIQPRRPVSRSCCAARAELRPARTDVAPWLGQLQVILCLICLDSFQVIDTMFCTGKGKQMILRSRVTGLTRTGTSGRRRSSTLPLPHPCAGSLPGQSPAPLAVRGS